MNDKEPDEQLMVAIAAKDFIAYRTLINRHLNRCVRFCERVLGNRQDAEDIVQNISIKIWNDAANWKPRARFTTWLYRVMLHACIDHKRKFSRLTHSEDHFESVEDTSPNAEERLMREERSRQVQAALARLNDQQRAAVVLSYYEELSNQQAADAMEMKLGAFQQLLFRARHSLRAALGGDTKEAYNV